MEIGKRIAVSVDGLHLQFLSSGLLFAGVVLVGYGPLSRGGFAFCRSGVAIHSRVSTGIINPYKISCSLKIDIAGCRTWDTVHWDTVHVDDLGD
jgi:hypothetical protein